MRLSDRLESIFAHAVALQQSGRLKSTIYCLGTRVYILNQDQTVFLRFSLRATDKVVFEEPISFEANDYDSQHVDVAEGRIRFRQESGKWERVKSCKTPRMTPKEVAKLFRSFEFAPVNTVTLHSKLLSLLDENLSHVEFRGEEGQLVIAQRNIYSGSITEIREKDPEGFAQRADQVEDFEPIGMRTGDFLALFSFTDRIHFHFLPDGYVGVESAEATSPWIGVVSKCRYDELGTTEMRPNKTKEA